MTFNVLRKFELTLHPARERQRQFPARTCRLTRRVLQVNAGLVRNHSWLTDVDKISKEDAYNHWWGKYSRIDGDDSSRAFISFDDNESTVSEAIGWGMLINVYMDRKDRYDSLLGYYHAHGNHKTINNSRDGFMKFKQNQRNRQHDNRMVEDGGDGAATDAELDVALSFLLAGETPHHIPTSWNRLELDVPVQHSTTRLSKTGKTHIFSWRLSWLTGEKPQWGQYYHNQGIDLCQNLLHYCINPYSKMPMLGDWSFGEQAWNISDNDPQIQAQMRSRFPDGRKTATRSVDWMLAPFQYFSQMDTARQTDWKDVFKACIKNFKANVDRQDAQHKTGLISDFLLYKSTSGLDAYIYEIPDGKVLEKEPQDAYYFYNACRVPWKLAMYSKSITDPDNDAAWQEVKDAVWTLKGFFEDLIMVQGKKVSAGYKIDGTALNESDQQIAFTAPVWRLLKVMGADAAADKVEADLCKLINDGQSNYYGDTILLLSLLQTE